MTPRHKRNEWTGLWDEERKNDQVFQKQHTDTDTERQKKASMWEALDEAAKRDDENISRSSSELRLANEPRTEIAELA